MPTKRPAQKDCRFKRGRCPPTAFRAAIRLERRRRHAPSRKAALKKTTGSHARPKDLHIGQDVAQAIRSKPMAPMSELGQSRRFDDVRVTSAFPPIAPNDPPSRDVSNTPQPDVYPPT